MYRSIFQFLEKLTASLVVVFAVHVALLKNADQPLFSHKIIFSYAVHFVLAAVIYVFLYVKRLTYKDQLGFLYMGGSFLKFAVYFVFFYGAYHADGNLSKLEFAAFFVPYATCLVVETIGLITLLNSPEQNQ